VYSIFFGQSNAPAVVQPVPRLTFVQLCCPAGECESGTASPTVGVKLGSTRSCQAFTFPTSDGFLTFAGPSGRSAAGPAGPSHPCGASRFRQPIARQPSPLCLVPPLRSPAVRIAERRSNRILKRGRGRGRQREAIESSQGFSRTVKSIREAVVESSNVRLHRFFASLLTPLVTSGKKNGYRPEDTSVPNPGASLGRQAWRDRPAYHWGDPEDDRTIGRHRRRTIICCQD
jgi:hypothetical protein